MLSQLLYTGDLTVNVKIMTSNVWADFFGNPVSPRDILLAEIIKERHPDAIAFQEMHQNWHAGELKPRLFSLGYAEVTPDLQGNEYNCTPVLYDTHRFREIRSYFHVYGGPNDLNSKSYTAVCLEEKESGARIGMIATHFWYMWDEEGNAAREQNARELTDGFRLFDDCAAVFCGGDFNCNEHSSPFSILEDAGIVTSHKIAGEVINPICTWHGDPVYDSETGTYSPSDRPDYPLDHSLDHILVRKGTKISRCEILTDRRARIISDHSPVIAEAEV